jgi:class 3 adenylate cyclase
MANWGTAAPLLTREFGGEVEKFIGDSIVARLNSRGDQPDDALRASRAALALQSKFADDARVRAVGAALAAPASCEIGGLRALEELLIALLLANEPVHEGVAVLR